jgi:hypothetical protein
MVVDNLVMGEEAIEGMQIKCMKKPVCN